MLRSPRPVLATAILAAPLLVAAAAHAQTVRVAQATPNRVVGGQDVTSQQRPQNLNPAGVSYSDCINDMQLEFPLILSGFTGQSLQIWASATQSCQTDVNRGKSGTPPVCWQLAGSATAINQPSTYSTTVSVRVQDLVGPQQSVPTSGTPVNEDMSACSRQPSFAAVPITVSFVPVNSAGIAAGTGVDVTVQTDLVGPPPPTKVTWSVGDTLFNVGWTPNTDTDTVGYDIYVAANGAGADAATSGDGSALNVYVCDDASSTGTSSSSSSSGGSSDASGSADSSPDATDDGSAAGADAGVSDAATATPPNCHFVVPSSSGATGTVSNAGTCMSPILSQGFVAEGGSTTTPSVYDEAGVLIDGGQTVTGGGISQIPPSYLVGSNGTTTLTISGQSGNQYTISPLTNGTTYNVVVAAVDGYGNIGPPSTEVCDFPAPVNDFFKLYRLAGGGAGGGYCTLEAAGAPVDLTILAVPVAATAFGLARRRRRRKP